MFRNEVTFYRCAVFTTVLVRPLAGCTVGSKGVICTTLPGDELPAEGSTNPRVTPGSNAYHSLRKLALLSISIWAVIPLGGNKSRVCEHFRGEA